MVRSLALVPDREPMLSPPEDYQHIQSNPDMFGGLIARSEEQAGAKFQQTGEQFLNVYDQLASTQAYSDYQRQVTDLLYGNPEAGVKGYLSMTGQEAMDALPQVRQKMEALVGQIKSGLKTNGAQIEFERGSRRLQSYMLEQAGRHYDSQSKVWGASVQDGAMGANERQLANTYNDDELFNHLREDQRRAAVQKAQLLGHDPTGAIAEADSRAVQARLNGALAQRDYATADKIYQTYGNLLDDKIRPAYETHIHAGLKHAGGDALANGALGLGPMPSPGGLVLGGALSGRVKSAVSAPEQYRGLISDAATKYGVPADLLTRVFDAESGFNPNAVSPKGARGIAQFMPGTAARYGIDPTKPEQAIPGAARYLADLKVERGTWVGALTGYLGGDPRNDASYTRSGAVQLAVALDSGKALPARGSIEIWGDSLGVGLQHQLKTPGTVHGGDTPSTILSNIKAQPEGHWQGKTVVLPSGSNGNELPVVEETIQYLKGHGANVIAVGYGPKFPEKNAQLQEIAQRQGVPVIAAEGVDPTEGVHPGPQGYQAMAQKISAAAAKVQPIPTETQQAAVPPQPPVPPQGAPPNRSGLPPLSQVWDKIWNTPGYDDEQRAYAWQKATSRYNAFEADAARAERIRLQQQTQAMKKRESEIWADVYSPNPTITASQIAVDPAFNGNSERRKQMIELINNPPGSAIPQAQSWQAALSAVDDIREGKITDQGQLYDQYLHKVNKSDWDFIKKQFDEIRTPGGEVFAKRKGDFLKSVEPQIDKSNPLMGKIDQSGKSQFYAFEWALDQKIDEYRKAGKNPQDLLDPSKPDYMGRPEALQEYQKTLQQSLKDRVSGLTGQRAPVAPPSAASVGIQERQPGESIQDYMKRVGMGLVPSAAAQPSVPLAR